MFCATASRDPNSLGVRTARRIVVQSRARNVPATQGSHRRGGRNAWAVSDSIQLAQCRAVGAFHLAQVNIALPRQPLDAPLLAEFVARLDPVNASADAALGFVWRLQ